MKEELLISFPNNRITFAMHFGKGDATWMEKLVLRLALAPPLRLPSSITAEFNFIQPKYLAQNLTHLVVTESGSLI